MKEKRRNYLYSSIVRETKRKQKTENDGKSKAADANGFRPPHLAPAIHCMVIVIEPIRFPDAALMTTLPAVGHTPVEPGRTMATFCKGAT